MFLRVSEGVTRAKVDGGLIAPGGMQFRLRNKLVFRDTFPIYHFI